MENIGRPRIKTSRVRGSYYLSEWIWDTSTYLNHWKSPDNTVGLIDLRNYSECAKAGGVPDVAAKGFFATSQPDSNLDLYLGDSLFATVLPRLRRQVETVLGLSVGAITATTVGELLAQVLTEQGDPTGANLWKPISSNEIHLGGHSEIWRGDWKRNQKWKNNWLAIKQNDYRQVREAVLSGNENPKFHRQVLDYWSKRHSVPPELFIPGDLPIESPLLHSTTVGDTFVEASNTALGSHTATGPNGGFSWTVINGGGTVIAATDDLDTANSGGENNFRAEGALSGDDHYAEVYLTIPSGSGRDGRVYTRFEAASWDGYLLLCDGSQSFDTKMYKVISGSGTLINDYNDAPGAPTNRQFKLESDGSTHTPTVGGSTLGAQTDTQFTGQVRGGTGGWSNLTTIDNYEAADLAAGGGGFQSAWAMASKRSKILGAR